MGLLFPCIIRSCHRLTASCDTPAPGFDLAAFHQESEPPRHLASERQAWLGRNLDLASPKSDTVSLKAAQEGLTDVFTI
jgi:hypothetical protein